MTVHSEFAIRLATLATALAPALPIGTVLFSVGRHTITPGAALTAAAAGLVAAFTCLLGMITGPLVNLLPPGLPHAAGMAFLGAGVPEELAKLGCLVLMALRHLDTERERDAILLGGYVGLGFAIIENFLYVTGSADWLATGSVRATLSVPGHVSWGLIMGYFVSRGRYGLAFLVPMLLHGLFDAVLMYDETLGQGTLPNSMVNIALFGLLLVSTWLFIRGPVCTELARLEDMPSPLRIADEAAQAWWIAGGVATIVLIIASVLIPALAAWGSYTLDMRYMALALLAVMPITFADVWRSG